MSLSLYGKGLVDMHPQGLGSVNATYEVEHEVRVFIAAHYDEIFD